MLDKDTYFMRMALREAEQAFADGEVPVGAVIVAGDRVLAKTHNLTETLNDVTAHAEMLAITAASEALGGKYLPQCALYVTVEPCPMCAGALGWAQIGKIIYGASEPQRAFHSACTPSPSEGRSPLHPKTVVEAGLLAGECSELMREFFRSRR